MESPPAEPVKEENRKAFEAAYTDYKAQIDTIQAVEHIRNIFEIL